MPKILFSFLLLTLGLSNAKAQNRFSNNFPFTQGIYLQFEDFRYNQPACDFSRLSDLSYVLSNEGDLLVFNEKTQKDIDSIYGKNIWGVCINEIPYIRTDDKQDGRPYFVKLHVVGKISYFHYRTFREKELIMYVHNPFSGEKIGERKITNKEFVSVERILHTQTGETTNFNLENLRLWTQDDPGLNRSLMEMQPNEAEEKLFKTLLIYNDRNLVYIK